MVIKEASPVTCFHRIANPPCPIQLTRQFLFLFFIACVTQNAYLKIMLSQHGTGRSWDYYYLWQTYTSAVVSFCRRLAVYLPLLTVMRRCSNDPEQVCHSLSLVEERTKMMMWGLMSSHVRLANAPSGNSKQRDSLRNAWSDCDTLNTTDRDACQLGDTHFTEDNAPAGVELHF